MTAANAASHHATPTHATHPPGATLATSTIPREPAAATAYSGAGERPVRRLHSQAPPATRRRSVAWNAVEGRRRTMQMTAGTSPMAVSHRRPVSFTSHQPRPPGRGVRSVRPPNVGETAGAVHLAPAASARTRSKFAPRMQRRGARRRSSRADVARGRSAHATKGSPRALLTSHQPRPPRPGLPVRWCVRSAARVPRTPAWRRRGPPDRTRARGSPRNRARYRRGSRAGNC